ncbi:MAG: prepilin-type N-terminal cleavage/methylation domain-containing protein, partial [Pseudomonadota bacterium]
MSRAPVLRRAQAGFSLLEVLITTGILAGAAYVALSTVEIDTGRHRYEMTEQRLDAIRRALVGDTGLAANGSPVVSGFVADIGQLPPCLQALVVREVDCDGDGTDDFTPPAYNFEDFLSYGWRGPYLTTRNGSYPDAWGNDDGGVDFGWNLAVPTGSPPPVDALTITSLARDRMAGDTSADGGYDVDQTLPIPFSTFQTAVAGLEVALTNDSGGDVSYCAALIVPDPADETDWTYLVGTPSAVLIANGDTADLGFDLSSLVS